MVGGTTTKTLYVLATRLSSKYANQFQNSKTNGDQSMQNAILEILEKIPKGMAFDSHYIINQLINFYSDKYLNFASRWAESNEKTLSVHVQIGKAIASFEPDTISRLDYMSWSENSHGNSSECTAWVKLL